MLRESFLSAVPHIKLQVEMGMQGYFHILGSTMDSLTLFCLYKECRCRTFRSSFLLLMLSAERGSSRSMVLMVFFKP